MVNNRYNQIDLKQKAASIIVLVSAIICILSIFLLPFFESTNTLKNVVLSLQSYPSIRSALNALELDPTMIDIIATARLIDVFGIITSSAELGPVIGPFVGILVIYIIVALNFIPSIFGILILFKVIPLIKLSINTFRDNIFIGEVKKKFLFSGIGIIIRVIFAAVIPLIIYAFIIESQGDLEFDGIKLKTLFTNSGLAKISDFMKLSYGFYFIIITGSLIIVSGVLLSRVEIKEKTTLDKAKKILSLTKRKGNRKKIEGLSIVLIKELKEELTTTSGTMIKKNAVKDGFQKLTRRLRIKKSPKESNDISHKLRQIKEMYEEGLIDEKDFQEKKKEILTNF